MDEEAKGEEHPAETIAQRLLRKVASLEVQGAVIAVISESLVPFDEEQQAQIMCMTCMRLGHYEEAKGFLEMAEIAYAKRMQKAEEDDAS